MIYLGRFDHHDYLWERDYYGTGSCEYNSVKRYRNMGLHYFFVDVDYDENEEDNSIKYKLTTMKSISSKFIDTVSPECTPRYADLYSALEHCDEFSPYDSTKDEYIPYTFEEVAKRMTKDENGYYCSYMSCFNGNDNKPIDIRRYHSGNQYEDVFYIEGEYQQYVKNPTGWGTHRNPNPPTESLEEIFNRVNPSYKKLYLENGKSYGYERKYY
jgi:hypothetical protein